MSAHDDAQFLLGSPARRSILRALAEGVSRPRDLVEATDVSRTSVQRNLAGFHDRGWVARDAGTYRVTAEGRHVLRQCERFLRGLEGADRAAPLLDLLPTLDPDLDAATLADATVVEGDPREPYVPVERYVEWLDGLSPAYLHGIAPVLSGVYEEGHEELLAGGVETELVIGPELLERAREQDPEEFRAALAIDEFTLFVSTEPVEFGLVVTDEEVFLGGYDESGQMRAGLYGDDPDLHEWAERTYRRYRERATQVRAES